MSFEDLNEMCNEFDKMYAAPMKDQIRIGTMHSDILTMRINLEIAAQLAFLNERGTSLHNVATRGPHLCVSVEQDIT